MIKANTLIIDDGILQTHSTQWFVWVKTPEGQPDIDWSAYASSVPEGVKLAHDAGYPVSYWMRLSNKVPMSAEAIFWSQQQLDKLAESTSANN